MKINAMNLEDITRYSSFATKFSEKISVVVGPNASGKTTILDSLTYALTGQCARTDRAGRGAENMIRSGGKEGQVILEVASNGQEPLTIARKIPGGLAIAGQAGNATILEQNLADYLGVDRQVMAAALSTSAFLDMRPAEQKAMLFELLGLQFDRANIIDQVMMEAVNATTLEVQAQAMERMLKAAPESLFDGTGSTFANLHKHFYELRRNFKRELKEMGTPPAVTLTNGSPPVEEVVEQLEGLREILHAARAKRDEAMKTLDYARSLDSQITQTREQLKEAGDPEAAAQKLKIVQEDIAKAQLDGANYNARIITLKDTVINLKSGECFGGVKCPATKPKKQALIDELTAKVAALEKEAKDAKDAADFLIPRREELNAAAAVSDKSILEANLARLEMELKELPTAIKPQALEPEVAELKERISKGEAILADIQREEGAASERDKQQQRRGELEQTIEVLEALVEVLSPAGLPGKILSETIQPIQKHANERLEEITGGTYSLKITLDPDFAILVNHAGVVTDLKRLSSSERLRVGVVLQDALVSLSGLRFLIVDNVDVLDENNRALLIDALVAMADDYDQMLVLSTISKVGVTNPHIPGLAVFKLNDGQLEAVK